jgi:GT2 family glycosyltransferase
MIYIVIPVFNRWHFTKACLASLAGQTDKEFVTVVVDHGSTDGTSLNIQAEFPDVVVLKGDESMWWTAATNAGVKYALDKNADHILTLNNDLVVGKDYIGHLVSAALANPKSIIGSVSLDIDLPEKVIFAGSSWNAWIAKYRSAVDLQKPYSVLKGQYTTVPTAMLPGRGTLIPATAFREAGLFDEVNFPHYMADDDFSLRAQKLGYALIVDTRCVVFSHVGATGLNGELSKKKRIAQLKADFTSIRSPTKLSVRWQWARKHGKSPLLYFAIDIGRVAFSNLKKRL